MFLVGCFIFCLFQANILISSVNGISNASAPFDSPTDIYMKGLFLVKGSNRKYTFCNTGTFYSDRNYTAPFELNVTTNLFVGNTSNLCYTVIVYPENMTNDSPFFIKFLHLPLDLEAHDESIEADYKALWGDHELMGLVGFNCSDASLNGTKDICNSMDMVIHTYLNIELASTGSRSTVNGKQEYITSIYPPLFLLRKILWKSLYPQWRDYDYELYMMLIENRGNFPVASLSGEAGKTDRLVPLRLLSSEDSIDLKQGNFLTLGVICMICMYAIIFGLAYKSIKRIKTNENNKVFQS